MLVSYMRVCVLRQAVTNLTSYEDGPKAVEQLKWRHDAALHQQAGAKGSSHPPPRTDRHLIKPLLERELADHAAAATWEHVRHAESGTSDVFVKRRWVLRVSCANASSRVNERAWVPGNLRAAREREASCM